MIRSRMVHWTSFLTSMVVAGSVWAHPGHEEGFFSRLFHLHLGVDHWVAFAILLTVGVVAWKKRSALKNPGGQPLKFT